MTSHLPGPSERAAGAFGWPEQLIVIDTEGNGEQPPDLVELAAIPFTAGLPDLARGRSTLIRPPQPITQRATTVHQITNQMTAAAPAWPDIADQVGTYLDGAWIVAHNAHVDYRVLVRHLPDWRPAGVIDTLRLARSLHPEAGSHTLDAMLALLGIDTGAIYGARHRAWFDAHATALMLTALAARTSGWPELAAIAVPPGLPGRTQPGIADGEATLW